MDSKYIFKTFSGIVLQWQTLLCLPFPRLLLQFLYLFQTDNQALNKTKRWSPLITHCIIYTFILTGLEYLITGFISWLAIVVIFTSHLVLDNGNFIKFWAKKVKRIDNPDDPKAKLAMFELDQAFHYIIIFFVSFM